MTKAEVKAGASGSTGGPGMPGTSNFVAQKEEARKAAAAPLITAFGKYVRMERRAFPEQEPEVDAQGTQLKDPRTGEGLTKAKLNKDGSFLYVWVVYELVDCAKHPKNPGRFLHPVINGPDGKPAETTHGQVWVIIDKGPEDKMRALAESHSKKIGA